MDAFREPTPEEAKMIALQFMGQNIGALKELDKNIISKTNTLQGNRLDVKNILNSIPTPTVPQENKAQPSQQMQRQFSPAVNYNGVIASNNDALVGTLNKVTTLLETIIKLLEKR